MKFRRNVGLYRGSLDAAPLATVFFLLVIFMILGSRLYTPGVHINLQAADAADVSGTDKPIFTVALDSAGRFYHQSQMIERDVLRKRLTAAAKNTPDLVLLVMADKDVTDEKKAALYALASAVGIKEAREARLPQQAPKSVPKGGSERK